MISRKFLTWLGAGAIVSVVFMQWLRLPLSVQDIWMSPDETANATVAKQWADKGRMFFNFSLGSEFVWAHPRSFVVMPELQRMVPVGFLGLPVILAIVYKISGDWGMRLAVPILALSAIIPLYASLPKKWNGLARMATVYIWMTFPTVIVYANRGAFAQLPLISLAIWMWWCGTGLKQWWRWIFVGMFFATAVFIRPTELIWLLPVLAIMAGIGSMEDVKMIADIKILDLRKVLPSVIGFSVPVLAITLFGLWLGHQTYGQWGLTGYQIRPVETQSIGMVTPSVDLIEALPFGLHPKNYWWNVTRYYGYLLWPWSLVFIVATVLLYLDRKKITVNGWLAVLAMMMPLLTILFYGNGVYQDHVRPNAVSIANSFIRYSLPMSVVMCVAAGYTVHRLTQKKWFYILGVCLAAGLGISGLYLALTGDEGMLANQAEFMKYAQIRRNVEALEPKASLVVSDRSDKIFFPQVAAVSPMPNPTQLKKLVENFGIIGAYARPFSDDQVASLRQAGLRFQEAFSHENMVFYHMY